MNPAELASWTLMASFLTANATYFVGAIIVFQLAGIWMKRDSA